MPVVINELELSPATQESAGSAVSSSATAAGPSDEHQIEKALAQQMERCARVRAH